MILRAIIARLEVFMARVSNKNSKKELEDEKKVKVTKKVVSKNENDKKVADKKSNSVKAKKTTSKGYKY